MPSKATTRISTTETVKAQLDSLDDTDCYASVWEDILSEARKGDQQSCQRNLSLWGGRGKGGRGLSRRTIQPYDVIVENVGLQYLGMAREPLLEGASLKLLAGHTYFLCGKNGSGKSTLLQRMHAQKIPGWSTEWTSLYLPPTLPMELKTLSPQQVLYHYRAQYYNSAQAALEFHIEELQLQLETLDMDSQPQRMEQLCDDIANLEDQLELITAMPSPASASILEKTALDALKEWGVHDSVNTVGELSLGMQKRIMLSVLLFLWGAPGNSMANLILLDEPTAHLGVQGLLVLREIVEHYRSTDTTMVMVSHDVDFINDVATDVIELHNRKLWYFPGNYDQYRLTKEQQELHGLRQSAALERKKGQLLTTLRHLKEQPTPKRGGAKKKAKAVASHRKKLDRHHKEEIQLDASSSDASSCFQNHRGLNSQQRLKLAEVLKKVPDKAVHFVFPDSTATWGEPLITALEVGFAYRHERNERQLVKIAREGIATGDIASSITVANQRGYLFDCVDFCVEEFGRYAILGPSSSGKSTLLGILGGKIPPTEGKLRHCMGLTVGYVNASCLQQLKQSTAGKTTALEYLKGTYPKKTEQELRGHFSAFGLSSRALSKTEMVHLSSGECFRLALAIAMLSKPPILILDDPTLHLDVESVGALIYGLNNWNGTLLLASADANLLRSLNRLKCAVLMPAEGKLMRLEGGIDAYLRSFQYT